MANLTEQAKQYLESFYSGPKMESFNPVELKAIMAQSPVPLIIIYQAFIKQKIVLLKQKMVKKLDFAFIHQKERVPSRHLYTITAVVK